MEEEEVKKDAVSPLNLAALMRPPQPQRTARRNSSSELKEAPFGIIIAKPRASSSRKEGEDSEDSQDEEEMEICEPAPDMDLPQQDPSPCNEEIEVEQVLDTATDNQTVASSILSRGTDDDDLQQQSEGLSEVDSDTSICPADTGQLEVSKP